MLQFHKKKYQGFILLITLLFMQIFSLTTLAELTFIKLNLKFTRHQLERMNSLQNSKMMLDTIENNLTFQIPYCIIPTISTQSLINKSIFWWETNACSSTIDRTNYYYVIESLGKNLCALIENIDENHNIIADYYRITLLSLSTIKVNKSFLQSTIILPSNNVQPCTDILRQVKIGRQILREL
ncbi:MAG TPA: hypothetical protein VJN02_04960 [Gammaproteobacteria bacterium]|nr:hypothetical protein [Gammaproteobacteria bacterium]